MNCPIRLHTAEHAGCKRFYLNTKPYAEDAGHRAQDKLSNIQVAMQGGVPSLAILVTSAQQHSYVSDRYRTDLLIN